MQAYRILVASDDRNLVDALSREVERLHCTVSAVASPRDVAALASASLLSDILVIDADDLVWLMNRWRTDTIAIIQRVRSIVILSNDQILDMVSDMPRDTGLLLRRPTVPVDMLELAISGYLAVTGSFLLELAANRPRLNLVEGLSAPERQVLGFLGLAMSDHGIAEASGFSEVRVKLLAGNVMRKLHLGSRTAAAVFAATNGLAAVASE